MSFCRWLSSLNHADLVLEDVFTERARQDERWGEQNHPDVSDLQAPGLGEQVARVSAAQRADYWKAENARRADSDALSWDGILLEEVYEALAEEDPAALRAELIQVAAVAACWVQAIDRREAASE